jgi:CheY-like chemotaxis protein
MVHGLMAQSGGTMQIESEVGKGTTVRLWFPVDRGGVTRSTSRESELPVPAQSCCRVMVVDDDPLILSSTAAMLEDLGHTVIEASSAIGALEILRAEAKVDVVVTDYAMPRMTGLELAAIIREQWPWVPVILASGYAELQEGDDFSLPRLAKPYHQSELASCIAKVTEARKIIPIEAARRA